MQVCSVSTVSIVKINHVRILSWVIIIFITDAHAKCTLADIVQSISVEKSFHGLVEGWVVKETSSSMAWIKI